MLKLDILVPVILIVCLIALAYILSQIFNEPEKQRPDQTEIVLDPSRYTDDGEATNGSSANISNTPGATTDLQAAEANERDGDNLIASGANNSETAAEDNTNYQSPAYGSQSVTPPTTDYVSENERSEQRSSTSTTTTTTSYRHKYVVIAGTFRQESNARQRLRELRRSGFGEAELGFTNRGAYAVAVAGKSDSEMNARQLAAKVQAKGYEAFVKQRRR